jgi:PAS domain S-box-containing protein
MFAESSTIFTPMNGGPTNPVSPQALLRIFDCAPVMINVIGADGRITLVNQEWERTLGWSRHELAELDIFTECYPDPEYRAWVMSCAAAATGQLVDCRTRVRDGRVIDTVWAVVRLGDGLTVGIGKDVSERRQAQEGLQTFSRRLLEAQEAERQHLARELHDEIGQALTGLSLILETAARSPMDTIGVHMNAAQALARELLGRVRNLSLDLRPPPLDDLGLHAALLWHFERYTSSTGVQVGFTQSGLAGQRFGRDVEIAVYRIVQETLTNVARHSGATEVSVHVAVDHNVLRNVLGVEIEDRGRGFDPEAALTSVSSGGLLGMRERARLLNGAFEVKSAPGAGARVTAEFPLVDSPSRTRA